jgi:Cu-Zn family superoxide dismutase
MAKTFFWSLTAIIVVVFALVASICVVRNTRPTVRADIYMLIRDGIADKLGTVVLTEVNKGLDVEVKVKGLTPGQHGFHIHEGISCGSVGPDGNIDRGLPAEGHYDPTDSGHHSGPDGGGHAGDLPYLIADEHGEVDTSFRVQGLSVEEIAGRAIVIHDGGDNYSDSPKPLGGGGGRFGCGILELVRI